MRKLIPKVEEIIQIANTPIMAGLRNSNNNNNNNRFIVQVISNIEQNF